VLKRKANLYKSPTTQSPTVSVSWRGYKMARLFQAAYTVIITISTLVTTWTLSNDINDVDSRYRERRALVFPTGTVLQVR
jgi:hypothetical protein